jgi:hypothetical protein
MDLPSCTGGTFNPSKQYCWLRTGDGTVTTNALGDDYGFSVGAAARSSYFTSLMAPRSVYSGTGVTALATISNSNPASCYLACLDNPSCSGATFSQSDSMCRPMTGPGQTTRSITATNFAFGIEGVRRNSHTNLRMMQGKGTSLAVGSFTRSSNLRISPSGWYSARVTIPDSIATFSSHECYTYAKAQSATYEGATYEAGTHTCSMFRRGAGLGSHIIDKPGSELFFF